jgi:crotonobetainyl-CoA:carnitine CoA-transferase CaiB-like acyl-CoA transferase
VITVRDDADWANLRRALGDPEWAAADELQQAAGRFASHDAIDLRLAEWTRALDKYEVARRLQDARVPAAPMLTATGMLDDPHYKARGFERPIEQQDLGRISMEGPAFRATGMSDVRIFQAPRLGEHTRAICRDLLGLEDPEIERLIAEGALEVAKA